jgi:hypothetical protein
MNFFAARHGWSDCDRHFGSAKRHISKWMMTTATRKPELTLDVHICHRLIAELPNSMSILCSSAKVTGVLHESVKGLTAHYCFKATQKKGEILAFKYSDCADSDGTTFQLPRGRFVAQEVADNEAKKRNKY